MSISLYKIEEALLQLAETREEIVAEDADNCKEQLDVIDKTIREYVQREPEKIRSCVGYVRQQRDRAIACQAEKLRYAELERTAKANAERMLANVLYTMQSLDIKALIDVRTGEGFVKKGNGGVEPLIIQDWPVDASGDYKPAPVKGIDWLIEEFQVPVKLLAVPDTAKIREVLKSGGEVTGAKLGERGEHVKVL
jgi:Siphovirus Gp157